MNGFDIILENGKKENILRGTKFKDLMDKYYKEDIKNIALCRLNNKYYELTQEVKESGILEIIYFNTEEGMNIYTRTLQFIFITAALDVFKDSKITIEHSIGKGLFGEIHKEKVLNDDDIKKIKKKMKEIINKDEPIKKIRVSKSKAIDIFENYGMEDKVKLLEHVDFDTVKLYELEGRYDYFYGKMAYSTGVIRAFDLMLYETGFILRSPMIEDLDNIPPYNEQKRLSNILYE